MSNASAIDPPRYHFYLMGIFLMILVAFVMLMKGALVTENEVEPDFDRLAQIELTIEQIRVVQMEVAQGVRTLEAQMNELNIAMDKLANTTPVASSNNQPLSEKLDRDISEYMALIAEEAGSIADGEASKPDDGSVEQSE